MTSKAEKLASIRAMIAQGESDIAWLKKRLASSEADAPPQTPTEGE